MRLRFTRLSIAGLALLAPACEGEPGETQGELSCEGYADEAPTASLVFRIKNESTAPIFVGNAVGNCCGHFDLPLRDAAGNPIATHRCPCERSYSSYQEEAAPCHTTCIVAGVIMLAPGRMNCQDSDSWQTTSMLCPSGPMTNAA